MSDGLKDYLGDVGLCEMFADELVKLKNRQCYAIVMPNHYRCQYMMRETIGVLRKREVICRFKMKEVKNEAGGYLLFVTPESEMRDLRGRDMEGGYGLSETIRLWIQSRKSL